MPATLWRHLLRRLLLVLGLYTVLRGVFLWHNRALIAGVSGEQVGLAFAWGLRFDLAAIVAVNSPWILLSLLPWPREPRPRYERGLRSLFLALNAPFLIVNVIDVELFQFTGRRSTVELFGLATDAGVKWMTMVSYYWWLGLLGLLCLLALGVFSGRPRSRTGPVALTPAWLAGVHLVVAAVLGVVAIRGGLQGKPLSPAHAHAVRHGVLAQAALNSTFTFLRSLDQHRLSRLAYVPQREELTRYLRERLAGEGLLGTPAGRGNVVILIMESFAAEYCGFSRAGRSYTPCLDALARESLIFGQSYANARRSIDAIPAILAGLPALMEDAFLTSAYQSVELPGLGALLAREGYTTSFFHGGRNGTMLLDTFARLAGFQHYFGMNEYPNPADYDGDWGIPDEPFLWFVARELSRQQAPFAAAVFTLSSHHPYLIPARHRGQFPKGTLEIHEAIGYADYALGQFMAAARQQPWYTNTLFVVTADHAQKLETPEYRHPLGQYRVPLLFFHPARPWPALDTNRVVQQVDIMPSVMDYLGIVPARRLLFGQSVFRTGAGRAFLRAGEHYWLVRPGWALEFAPEGPSHLHDLIADPTVRVPLRNEPDRLREMEREAKALLQYYHNGLLDNRLCDPNPAVLPPGG